MTRSDDSSVTLERNGGSPEPPFGSDLSELLDPDSVALIGASTDREKIAGRVQYFLEKHDFDGDIYPINPKYDEIRETRCYDSVLDIPGSVDVAMILVPARITPTVLEECGEKGVPFNIIVASGFSEIGAGGEDIEAQLLEIAETYGVRILGPNSEGVLNLRTNSVLSFSSMLKRDDLIGGRGLAFVTQSGGFGGAIFQITQSMGIGTKYWISVGNEIDLESVEIIDQLIPDPDVDMIVGYIESLKRGDQLKYVAQKALKHDTPLLFLKVGESDRGRESVASHTGKVAGDSEVYRSVFDGYGVLTADSLTEFKDIISAFDATAATQYLRDEEGLGVVSVSGGAGALIADACAREGVPLAELSEATERRLMEFLPHYGSTHNPVDVTGNVVGNPDLFEKSLSIVLEDSGVGSLLLQFGNSGDSMGAEYFDTITQLKEKSGRLVIPVFTGGRPPREVLSSYREAGIPTFEDPVRAVKAVKYLTKFRSAAKRCLDSGDKNDGNRTVPADVSGVLNDNSSWETFADVATAFDLPVVRGAIACSSDEAVEFANEFGYPVVMKASAVGLKHKTEIGGVRLDVTSPEEVCAAFDDISDSMDEYGDRFERRGVLVQESVDNADLELVIGITSSTDLGPVMMFGLGGIFVEVLNDVTYRALPITERKAVSLIEDTRIGSILSGHRRKSYPVDDVIDAMVNTSSLFEQYNDIAEIDLNPVLVSEDEIRIVDFLIKSK